MCDQLEEHAPRFTAPKLEWRNEHFRRITEVPYFLDTLEHWQAVAAKVVYDPRDDKPYAVIFPET